MRSSTFKIVLSVLNHISNFGYVPESWKCAIVSPILKPNKPPGEALSYRPVFLTSCLCKFMERMIKNRLERFFDKNHILPKVQTEMIEMAYFHVFGKRKRYGYFGYFVPDTVESPV